MENLHLLFRASFKNITSTQCLTSDCHTRLKLTLYSFIWGIFKFIEDEKKIHETLQCQDTCPKMILISH